MNLGRFKASILLNVVVVSFLVILICGLLILSTYMVLGVRNENSNKWRLRNNIESAIVLVQHQKYLGDNFNGIIDLFGDGADSVYILKKKIGLLFYTEIKALHKNQTLSFSGLLGYEKPTKLNYCFYFPNLGTSLFLGEKVEINGVAYTPNAKLDFLENNRQSSNAVLMRSDKQIPGLDDSLSLSAYRLPIDNIRYISEKEFFTSDTLKNPFSSETLVYKSKKDVIIDNACSDNIIIYSDKSVIVKQRALLLNVRIIAKNIFIEDEFIGSGQFFAKDTFEIGRRVQLNYPSICMLHNVNTPRMKINEDSKINGAIILTSNNQNANAVIKNLKMIGDIYCNGDVNFTGSVYGSIVSKGFYSTKPNAMLSSYIDNMSIHQLTSSISGTTLIPLLNRSGLRLVERY